MLKSTAKLLRLNMLAASGVSRCLSQGGKLDEREGPLANTQNQVEKL